MKQTFTLLVTAIFCIVTTVRAQINKGSILLGGTINGYGSNLKDRDSSVIKASNFTVAPALGFAVSTNTVVGFSLSYSSSNSYDYGSPLIHKGHTYGAGVFMRKYKLLSKNFYLFGDGNLMYTHGSYDYSIHFGSPSYKTKANSVSLNVTPGIAYNLTRSIQLESGLQNLLYASYGTSNETSIMENTPRYKESSFNVGTSFNPISFNGIFVGIRFLINK